MDKDGYHSPGDPSRAAAHASLEVVGADREELIAHVQRLAAVDTSKVALAAQHAPGLVPDVYEDVASTWGKESVAKKGVAWPQSFGISPLKAQNGSLLPTSDISY